MANVKLRAAALLRQFRLNAGLGKTITKMLSLNLHYKLQPKKL